MTVEHSTHHHRSGIAVTLVSLSAILLLLVCAGPAAAGESYDVAYGDTVKIYVANPVGTIPAYLYIQGPNFPFTPLTDASGNQIVVRGSKRTVELDTSDIRSQNGKRPDVGTYTIYVSNNPDATGVRNLDSGNGYWDSYTLTIRPIGVTVDTVSTRVVTEVPTQRPTVAPVTEMPTPIPTSTPASPAPVAAVIAGLGAVVLALRR